VLVPVEEGAGLVLVGDGDALVVVGDGDGLVVVGDGLGEGLHVCLCGLQPAEAAFAACPTAVNPVSANATMPVMTRPAEDSAERLRGAVTISFRVGGGGAGLDETAG
jgi:hypothetical protein